ncbi:protein kinase domain-containing protein [Verticillium dahliae VdLs.17]|uniref:Protein kinase domain-containing protein n=1 Tax=Verticillium dahliae (strain VdLs.17 / ATCC MYA-4575 / FGSC 10137) TaxID=498257 RepID=G2XCW7_VERDV|nr:protein kinase domain-containing protein [Verticillium dahliae VdLs.17]EGY16835.1 protein kinase domain-containing protein [Verticillium dahliae VdLs.17]
MATKTPSDVHPGNLLLGANDNSIFQKLEDDEFARPIARKPYEDRTNYLSRLMKPKFRILTTATAPRDAVPGMGPAPKKDAVRRRERSSADIAAERLNTGIKMGESVPIPREKTLEAAEAKIRDNTKFLQFIRRALTWDPKARPTAKELLGDRWVED